jgi:hypothetical protein
VQQDAANKDVDYAILISPSSSYQPTEEEKRTDTTAEEREQERGVAGDLGRDLELYTVG